ncbi:MAG: hypothetical protein IJ800_07425 [Clostridia bacterium]|nr:hypothetical protein [Clostridia bacterium]
MKIYKVVPLPGKVVVKPKDSMTSAFNYLAEMIAQESVGGWELVSSMPINVVTKKRRLRTLEEDYNALIFAKEASEEEIKSAALDDAESKNKKSKKEKKNKANKEVPELPAKGADEDNSVRNDSSDPESEEQKASDGATENASEPTEKPVAGSQAGDEANENAPESSEEPVAEPKASEDENKTEEKSDENQEKNSNSEQQ